MQVLLPIIGASVILAIHLFLMSRALEDLNRPGRQVRSYDRTVWAFVIAFVGIIGPIAYFYYGREDSW